MSQIGGDEGRKHAHNNAAKGTANQMELIPSLEQRLCTQGAI